MGLAPTIVATIGDIIRAISRAGVDILLVEQNAQMALRTAQDAYILENSVITLQGAAQDLERSAVIREAYLGL